MSRSEAELIPVTEHERRIVENMYPLFIHDQWAYSETRPNEHGIIGSARNAAGNTPRSLAEQSEMLTPYWRESDTHHPFLIRVEGRPAGFCLVQSVPLSPEGSDYFLDEFFVLHPFRRQGVGRQAVGELWRNRPGSWCVDMKAENRPAHAFWSKVTAAGAFGPVEEVTLAGDYGQFIRMRFEVG